MNNATNVAFDIPDVPTRVSEAADARISPMLLQIASMGHVSLTMGTLDRPRFRTKHRPSLKERDDGFVPRRPLTNSVHGHRCAARHGTSRRD